MADLEDIVEDLVAGLGHRRRYRRYDCPDCAAERDPCEPAAGGYRTAGQACAACGAPQAPGARFCPACGADLAPAARDWSCFYCGSELPPGAKFCPGCGTAMR